MSMRRVDQGMAKAAADQLPTEVTRELRTRYRQLRVMAHTAGLAATYAFIASKEGDGNLGNAYRSVAEGIRKHLQSAGLLPDGAGGMPALEVLKILGDMDTVKYARASAEIVAFTGWLARLADAQHEAGQTGPAQAAL